MSGDEILRIRKKLGLTQAALAERLGVSSNTVARWERDEMRMGEPAARLVRLLAKPEARPKARKGGR